MQPPWVEQQFVHLQISGTGFSLSPLKQGKLVREAVVSSPHPVSCPVFSPQQTPPRQLPAPTQLLFMDVAHTTGLMSHCFCLSPDRDKGKCIQYQNKKGFQDSHFNCSLWVCAGVVLGRAWMENAAASGVGHTASVRIPQLDFSQSPNHNSTDTWVLSQRFWEAEWSFVGSKVLSQLLDIMD